ncbi:hypothetical protein D3C74_289580 [compost metagenome]
MQETARSASFQLMAGHPLHGGRAPVRTHIGKNLRRIRQQIPKQHADAVQTVVLRCHKVRRARAVPVERRIEHRLHEIAVREVIRPLTLPLEAGGNRVMALRFFLVPQFGKARVADHQVARDQRHFNDRLPFLVLALPRRL